MKKVLVANRGEIACRVMAALRERELASVGVVSEVDVDAAHARAADEVVVIGPAPAAESYLRIDRLVEAAQKTHADAVHPGYGFLAENAAFAQAVEDAGLVFLGPRPETIELLGDKRRARAVALQAGVPVVPGWAGDPHDLDGATRAAEEMDWPVLVKAALGGGGKGMSRVDRREDLAGALEAAARVASSSFGDASVYLEKQIERPRHVEVQILGDGAGEIVHLYERECSLQRHHQKVVEESPSTALSEETRRRLTDAAVAIGRAVSYRSAGTCEFLLDENGHFYFLEVNARIQVEHPVTELVTGTDLVHEQLCLAQTGTLRLRQENIVARGAAVEARVYAEDPDQGFLPQTGRVLRAEFPAGPGVRVDTGIASGDEISFHYDPMIAKIVAYGSSRDVAWNRLHMALRATVVHGPRTNLTFLRELTARPDTHAGLYDTKWIEETFIPERKSHPGPPLDWFVAAAALADHFALADPTEDRPSGRTVRVDDPFATLIGWRHPGLENGP